MNCVRNGDRWRIEFHDTEAHILASSLSSMIEHYALDYDSLPEPVREYWRGNLVSIPSQAESLADESEFLTQERLASRSGRLVMVEDWLKSYASYAASMHANTERPHEPWAMEVTESDLEAFLCLLNDRRLCLAALHHIGEFEMSLELEEIKNPAIRYAICEIDCLAQIQSYLLACLTGRFSYDSED